MSPEISALRKATLAILGDTIAVHAHAFCRDITAAHEALTDLEQKLPAVRELLDIGWRPATARELAKGHALLRSIGLLPPLPGEDDDEDDPDTDVEPLDITPDPDVTGNWWEASA